MHTDVRRAFAIAALMTTYNSINLVIILMLLTYGPVTKTWALGYLYFFIGSEVVIVTTTLTVVTCVLKRQRNVDHFLEF